MRSFPLHPIGAILLPGALLLTLTAACLFPTPVDAASIEGVVLNDLQQPVPGAIVYAGTSSLPIKVQNGSIHTGERYPRAITDKTGHFSIEVGDENKVVLLARDLDDRSGYVTAAAGKETRITITRPAALEPLVPGGSLSEGEALLVAAQTPPGLSYTFSTTARSPAPYEFKNLMPATYTLETTHQVPQLGCCFKKVVTRQVSTTVDAGAQAQVPLANGNMPYLHGTIADSDGNGLHGVWVRLLPLTGGDTNIQAKLQLASTAPMARVWSAVTEKDGTYQIDDVPPGAYTLRAFRRLALNSGSHTLEVVQDLAIPKMDTVKRVPYERNMTINLDQFAPLKVGDVAPLFEGTALDGTPVRLADFRGRIVVLHFYAGWCGPCVATIGDFNALATANRDNPVSVIAISLDESEEEARGFAQEKAINHPILYEGSWSKNKIREAYRVNGIPFTVVIGADGQVLHQHVHGEVLNDAVAQAVAALTPQDSHSHPTYSPSPR